MFRYLLMIFLFPQKKRYLTKLTADDLQNALMNNHHSLKFYRTEIQKHVDVTPNSSGFTFVVILATQNNIALSKIWGVVTTDSENRLSVKMETSIVPNYFYIFLLGLYFLWVFIDYLRYSQSNFHIFFFLSSSILCFSACLFYILEVTQLSSGTRGLSPLSKFKMMPTA
jgi:hypothetical protein